VLVFSHGLYGLPDVYLTHISYLVSHGFIVVAPEHTDGSAMLAQRWMRNDQDEVRISWLKHSYLAPAEKMDTTLEHSKRKLQVKQRTQG
jgi:hypothetical protein